MKPAVQTSHHFIRVVVLGEDPLVRRGLRSILEDAENVSIVAESSDPDATLQAMRELNPDILLMTFSLLQETSMGFITQVRQEFDDVYVVLTGMSVDQGSKLNAVEHGAFGFIPSDASPHEFIAAFQEAMSGESSIMSETARELLLHALVQLNGNERNPDQVLTTRECEVLQRMVHGMSNKEIGADLHISLGTVKAHVSNVLRKLDVSDRTQAVVKAIREGLVEP